MKWRHPKRFSILVAAFLGQPVWGAEPSYDGKPADYWLEHFSGSMDQMHKSIEAFKAMGSNAVPFLIKTVERKPSRLGKFVDEKLYKDGLAKRMPKGVIDDLPSAMQVEDRREHAAFLIGQIGPDAANAIPSLMNILRDDTEGWRIVSEARGALLSMGEKLSGQVPEFITYLESSDRNTRQLGAVLLATTGPKARAAVPALLKAAEGQDWWVSVSVADALWNIDHQTNIVVSIYTNALQSSTSRTSDRQIALIYLRKMGPAAKDAGPQVRAALADPDAQVRREATSTLREIDADSLQMTYEKLNEDTAGAVAKLANAVRSGDSGARFRAVQVLAFFGPDAKAAVPALIDILTGSAPQSSGPLARVGLMNERRFAAEALAEIGPEARSAAPALADLLQQHQDGNGAIYCRALGRIGPEAKSAVPALEEAMRDGSRGRFLMLAAATAVTRIVPQQSSNAVAVLTELRMEPDPTNAVAVPGEVPGRTTQMVVGNPEIRLVKLAASAILWRLGLEKESPVSAIIEEMNSPFDSDNPVYLELLGDMGRDARAALPTLRKYLGPGPFITKKRAAAIAIRKIVPGEAAKLGLPGAATFD